MRPIKFRAWDPDKKAFVTPILSDGRWYENGRAFEDGRYWSNCGAEQFTGLHDKNGREIYEGDVVRFDVVASGRPREDERKGECGVVGFRNGCYNFGPWASFWCVNVEKIGNIHETPELVK